VLRRRTHLSAARAGILDALINQPAPCTVAALAARLGQHPNTIREHLDGLSRARLVVRTRATARGRGRPAWLYGASPQVGSEPGLGEYAALASVLAAQIARTSRDPRAEAIAAGQMWGHDLVQQSRLDQGRPDQGRVDGNRVSEGRIDEARIDEARIDEARIDEARIDDGQVPAAGVVASAVAARRAVVKLLDGLGFDPTADARVGVVKLHRCPLLAAAHQHQEVVCGVHLGIVRGALDEMGADAERTESTALQPFSEPGACRLDLLPRSPTTG